MFRHPATLTGWPSRGVPDLLCGWRDSTPESHAISRACWRSEFELELRSDMTGWVREAYPVRVGFRDFFRGLGAVFDSFALVFCVRVFLRAF